LLEYRRPLDKAPQGIQGKRSKLARAGYL